MACYGRYSKRRATKKFNLGHPKSRHEMESNKMTKLLATILSKIWITIGTRLFPFIVIWRPNETSATGVITFATSQRDINIAFRSYIEWLDEEYEKRQNKKKAPPSVT